MSANDHSPSIRSAGFPNDVVTDDAGRKRRKVTHLTTAPLHNVPLDSQGPSNTAATVPVLPAPSYSDDYSHLLRWENVAGGDQIIDLPEEDDLQEEEDSEFEDAALEGAALEDLQVAEDDVVEKPRKRTKLSPDEIVAIINERIEFYEKAWRLNKGVPRGEEVDYDPVAMWTEAEAKGEREDMMQKYERDYDYYSHRLDELCEQIRKYPGSNVEQVRRQCSNLEITVDSMRLANWLLSIYQLGPVNDDDEELPPDDQDIATRHDQPRPQQNTSALQVEPSHEVIDLGSPPASSDIGDGNASPFDNDIGTAAESAEEQFHIRTRSSTRDSVIADSVEPIMYAHPGLLEPDGGLHTRTPINHGDEPENVSIATVRRWKWEDLIEHIDRKRVVSKTIQEMNFNDREIIRSRIRLLGKTVLIKETRACIGMLCKGETKLQGVLPRDMPKIRAFTKLFLSWWFCSNYSHDSTAPKKDLEELKECMDNGVAETNTFYDYVYTIMGTTFSEKALQHPDQPSQAEIIEISDDD